MDQSVYRTTSQSLSSWYLFALCNNLFFVIPLPLSLRCSLALPLPFHSHFFYEFSSNVPIVRGQRFYVHWTTCCRRAVERGTLRHLTFLSGWRGYRVSYRRRWNLGRYVTYMFQRLKSHEDLMSSFWSHARGRSLHFIAVSTTMWGREPSQLF